MTKSDCKNWEWFAGINLIYTACVFVSFAFLISVLLFNGAQEYQNLQARLVDYKKKECKWILEDIFGTNIDDDNDNDNYDDDDNDDDDEDEEYKKHACFYAYPNWDFHYEWFLLGCISIVAVCLLIKLLIDLYKLYKKNTNDYEKVNDDDDINDDNDPKVVTSHSSKMDCLNAKDGALPACWCLVTGCVLYPLIVMGTMSAGNLNDAYMAWGLLFTITLVISEFKFLKCMLNRNVNVKDEQITMLNGVGWFSAYIVVLLFITYMWTRDLIINVPNQFNFQIPNHWVWISAACAYFLVRIIVFICSSIYSTENRNRKSKKIAMIRPYYIVIVLTTWDVLFLCFIAIADSIINLVE